MNSQSSSDTSPLVPSRPCRRSMLGLALGLALGSVAVPAGLAASKPKPRRSPKARRRPNTDARRRPKRRPQRRPRYKVVTRTFASTVPIAIANNGPASPYPSTVAVRGLRAGRIVDVNVTLSGLSHTYSTQIFAILAAPTGQIAVVLMGDAGGGNSLTDVTLVFDDQAASFLPYEDQIVSGSYKPTLPGSAPGTDRATLRSFNGLNPNGAWRLYIADVRSGDSGSLDGWALTIRARVRA